MATYGGKAWVSLHRPKALTGKETNGHRTTAKKARIPIRASLRRLRNAVDALIHEAVFLDFTAEEIRQVIEAKLEALDWAAKPAGASK